MKRIIPFFFIFLFIVCSCSSISKGDTLTLTDDIPGVTSPEYVETIVESIRKHKPELGTRLFYLGHAERLEKGSKVVVKNNIDGIVCISYYGKIYYVDESYLSKYSK